MPYSRKYAGPLQPGKKSAYVPGGVGMNSRRTKAKRAPPRFAQNKPRYLKSRALSKVQNLTGESKLNALVRYNDHDPTSSTAAPSPVYQQNYCLGQVPAVFNNFDALDGFEFAQGVGDNDRVGRYMYLKKTTMHLKIALNEGARQTGPTRFRVIVYKSKRTNTPGQPMANPCENLFLDETGRQFGTDTSISAADTATQFRTALVNKRNYQVLKDKRFMLVPSVSTVSGSTAIVTPSSQSLMNEKNFVFNLGHWKKCSFSQDRPDDLNYTYCVTILSMPVGQSNTITNNWNTSVRGTVSASG